MRALAPTIPLKRVISSIESGVSVNALDSPADDGHIAVLKTSCVYTGRFDSSENKTVVPEEIARVACPVKAGTLIVSRMNTPDLVGATGLASTDLPNIFLPDRLWQVSFDMTKAEPSFVYWWAQSSQYRDQVRVACAGTSSSMQNLDQDSFRSFEIPKLSVPEQQRIANFLDEQTGRIDALIAEKERLLGALGEMRLSRLSEVVGAGSSPEAAPGGDLSRLFPTRPTGWRLTRLGLLATKIGSGKTPSGGAEVYVSSGIPLVRSMNVYDEGLRMEDVAYITEGMDEELRATRLAAGDILLNITGASIGRTCVVPELILPANINQHTCIVRLEDPRLVPFVALAMKSAQTKAQIDSIQNGAAREGLNFAQVARIALLIPESVERAQKIAHQLEEQLTRIDAARGHTQKHIARLREYRSSLISTAITGQLDLSTFKAAA